MITTITPETIHWHANDCSRLPGTPICQLQFVDRHGASVCITCDSPEHAVWLVSALRRLTIQPQTEQGCVYPNPNPEPVE